MPDIAALGLRVENGQVIAADEALKKLVVTSGAAEAATGRLGIGARRSAMQQEALVRSLGGLAAGGQSAAAGISNVTRSLSYLTLSNPQLFMLVTTIGLIAAGWEAVHAAEKDVNAEFDKLLLKNRTLLQIDLDRNRAQLAHPAGAAGVGMGGRALNAQDRGSREDLDATAILTRENIRLTSAINALDVVTGHAARTAAAHAAAHRKTAAEIQIETAAAMAATRAHKDAAAATTLWHNAQESLTRAHERETAAMRAWEIQARKNVELSLAAQHVSAPTSSGSGDFWNQKQPDKGGGLGGAFGGAVLGGLPTAAMALGVVTGMVSGFVNSVIHELFGLGESAHAAAIRLREAREQFTRDLEAFREAAQGTATGLAQAIRAVQEEAAKLRHEVTVAQALKGGALEEINRLEAERIRQLQAEAAVLRIHRLEDLQVRLLHAQGHDAEADAMAFALQQQREYADAVKAGADAQERATLLEVQRAEAIKFAADKIKATIEGLTTTIDSLRSFQASLRLDSSLTALSPIQQLQAARKSYEDVLALAKAGDQAAAGRLPDAARQFLTASRAVNASGGRYAVDFNRVMADTDAIAKIFEDQRSIQQQMLDALLGIQRNTGGGGSGGGGGGGSGGGDTTPWGPSPGDPNGEKPIESVVATLVAGFTQLTEEVAGLREDVQDGNRKTNQALEGLMV